MNLNLLAYLLFFPAMIALAVGVAQTCHRHGRPWMLGLFDNNDVLVDALNNILLVGCYLVNLGYIALVMAAWENVITIEHVLAGLHYENIAVLLLWSHFKHRARIDHHQHQP